MPLLLEQPGQIGPLRLKNRIVMSPMGTNFGTGDGLCSERDKLYYTQRAMGGVAMIIMEGITSIERARSHGNSKCVYHDRFIPGLASLTDAIHAAGALVVGQFGHRGGLLRRGVLNMEPVGPSTWTNFNTGEPVREITVAEILELQQEFLAAARRLRRAGFDAVEIHAANGYLFHQFFTPRVNKRTDQYGGSLENRIRFLLETVATIRDDMPDYPLFVRICPHEYAEGGFTVEDVVGLAQALERAGVSALSLTGGSNESPVLSRYCIQPPSMPRRCLEPHVRPVKEAVSIPVIMSGRIIEPADAEAVLQAGSADFVALGRALTADPYWVRKAIGEIDTPIRKCISCNVCFERLTRETDVSCVQNPVVGTEFERLEFSEPQAARKLSGSALTPSTSRKRVLVLGAGVAGIEAARILAASGHTVEVWEKGTQPGGMLRLGIVPPHKHEVQSVWSYRWEQIVRLDVPVRTGVTATAEAIRRYAPDLVIVATGGRPIVPPAFQAASVPCLAATEVLDRPDRIPEGSTVTVVGGGMVGVETAEVLMERGCRVTIVEMLSALAMDMPRNNRVDIALRLEKGGVVALTHAHVDGVNGSTLALSVGDQRREVPAGDYLVLALGIAPNRDVVPVVEESGFPYVLVGDCNRPGDFRTSIQDALLTALSIGS